MHDPNSRRRSWSRHTSKATCGLIKPSPPPAEPNPSANDTMTPRSMAKQSVRQRFFTVGAANTHLEKDREQRRMERTAYVPTHAASSFERTTARRHAHPTSDHEDGHYTTAPLREQGVTEADSDYAAFVSQSEARDVARELYGEHVEDERAPGRRLSNRVARRIVEYVKPPREER